MKTVKFILVAAIVSFAMMSFANISQDVNKPQTKIAIEKALMSRGLQHAMDFQITEDLIAVERQGFYYAKVRYKDQVLIIYGTLRDWKKYFLERKWVGTKDVIASRIVH